MTADGGPDPRVLVRVLGPCSLLVDGTSVELSQVQRRLVARLALAGAAGATVRALIDAVWGDEAPQTAKAAIQNQISRIRAVSGGGRTLIFTDADRYVLGAQTDADLLRDEARAAEEALLADDADAAGRLADQAVGRWRGQPYVELDAVADGERRTVAAAMAAAENIRLEAALVAGRTGWALQEALALTTDAPYDEHRAALLVRALEANGRRGDALAAVAEVRRRLRADLGIDMGTGLQAVEAAILDPEGTPASEAVPRWPYVGRGRDIAAAVAAATTGRSVLVDGEPGIGVSRFLSQVRAQVKLLGTASVALARCQANPGTAVSVLDDLLEELGLPYPPGLGALGGFVPAIAAATGKRPVVLLVDDVHLAGPSSLAALAAAAALDRVSVVAGGHEVEWRPGQVPEQVELLELQGLGVEAITQLLAAHTGRASEEISSAVPRLHRLSAGNPSFMAEILAPADAVAGLLEPSPDSESDTRAPARLDVMVRERISQLRPAERRAIEVCAVAGEGTPRHIVTSLAGTLGLVGAVDGGLLELQPDGRVRIRHGVVEQLVYQGISTGRRSELHHSVGKALAGTEGASPAAVAHHLLAATDIDPAAAVAAASEAASVATTLGAHRDAAQWMRRALEAAPPADDGAQRIGLRIALGDALRLAGDPEHVDVLIDAADDAERAGETDLMGTAAFALLQLGGATVSTEIDRRIRRISQQSLKQVTDPYLAAAIAGATSLALSMTGDASGSRMMFLGAERAATDADARRAVLPFAYLALGLPDDLQRRQELGEELVQISREAGDSAGLFEGLHLRFSSQLQEADGAGLRATQAAMEDLVDRVGDVGHRWAVHYQSASIAHLDDNLAAAERQAEEAFTLFGPVSPSRALAVYQAQLLPLRIVDGRLAELEQPLAMLVKEQPGVPAWHAAYGLALADSDPAAGAEQAGLALERDERDFTWLAAHLIGGRAAAGVGDALLAQRYIDRLAPWSGLACWQGTCSYGPVDTTLALLARAQGDEAAAGHYASVARRTAHRLLAPVFLRDLSQLGLD